ncbi:hypothetical protein CLI64_06945 [Nostoc sp. CENA543]|uniref:hypothetical protein n=1 Tax=Nostoc sp. CENA543 TaxID=1869241 RepID=UPI000CA0CAC3|nr:hypothetical protein [Nostoc sp. CENA543]AUT00137.1 hypothetical protein CLI64_06945 [Nostoc sp. CENA543]
MHTFTREHLENLKNLFPNSPVSHHPVSVRKNESLDPEETLFQILAIAEEFGSTKKKLVYGSKKDLIAYYQIDENNLPTAGTEVDQEFVTTDDPRYSAVRFLLQCRQLSQIMSCTWLDDQTIQTSAQKTQIELVREIFNSYNIIPDTYWLENHTGNLKLTPIKSQQLRKKIIDSDKKDEYLIHPEYVSYGSISLSLLLSGQVYYQDGNQWKQLWRSILSTYETIWEYALDVSWDTFYASRVDLSQTGYPARPPYTKVTLGYPPRPSEFSLKQEDIQRWSGAQETAQNGTRKSHIELPFYPERYKDKDQRIETEDWQQKKLKFVASPYPYIPLSTT